MDAGTDASVGREGTHDRPAAKVVEMLAVAFDGQHVVKRFFILPVPAPIS